MPQTRTQMVYPFQNGLKFIFFYAKEEIADIFETENKQYYQIHFFTMIPTIGFLG